MPRDQRYGRTSYRSDWEDERDYGRGRDEWRDRTAEYRSRRDEDDWSGANRQDRHYQGTLRAGDYGRYEEEQPYPPRFQDENRSSGGYGESEFGRRSGGSRYGSERDYGSGSGSGSGYGRNAREYGGNFGSRPRDYGSGRSYGYGSSAGSYGLSGGFGAYAEDYDRKYGAGRRSSGERRGGGHGYGSRQRDWWDRATDEVSSWFGDEDAERRRQMDEHRGRGPKNYSRSDERIREDVSDRLTDDPLVDASEIEVGVQNQEVTLTGTVASRNERRLAEECADGVSGVKYVQNNLRVRERHGGGSSGSNTFGSSSTASM